MSNPDSGGPSLQERYAPNGTCFGCGPANPDGLRIQSRLSGDAVVAEWRAKPEHEAFPGFLNGGIAGALLDCHSNWAATHHLMVSGKLDAPPCTVTAEYHVRFKRPIPTSGPIILSARVVEAATDRATTEATLEAGGQICATCRGAFVAVKPGHPAYHRW
ncbi:MAG: PaaI family thioesterase [Elusimicrobia bacterium]|nr:PaaI family thioesterase [Elusimicrobiota bacterium]